MEPSTRRSSFLDAASLCWVLCWEGERERDAGAWPGGRAGRGRGGGVGRVNGIDR